jgi:N-methylhydantoinase A
LRGSSFNGVNDIKGLLEDFHVNHKRIFAHNDPDSEIEITVWHASARCELPKSSSRATCATAVRQADFRDAIFGGQVHKTPVYRLTSVVPGTVLQGPAFVESDTTTIVVPPLANATRLESGSLVLDLDASPA